MTQQLTLELAREAGHAAAQACADKADKLDPGWIAAAVESLRRFARNQHGCWTIEQARSVIAEEVTAPHDLRAYGHITRAAIKAGYIERVKGAYAPAASSHSSLKPMYRRGAQA